MALLNKKLFLSIAGLATLSGLLLYSEIKENNFKKVENLKAVKDTILSYSLEDTAKKHENGFNLEKKLSFDKNWEEIQSGLYYSEFSSPVKSFLGDSKINILKINPKKYSFELVSAKQYGGAKRNAKEWATEKNLVAVVNAGMFKENNTNTGFMKNHGFINNGILSQSYNSIASFNRKDSSVPEFQIIDLKCQDWNVMKEKYNSFSQGIRMIDCNQKNVWAQQNKEWSMSILGEDKEGNALFIFSRSPYSVNNFIKILLNLPLNIKKAMYLEGGPEASFYLKSDKKEVQKFGSYETGFNENDDNYQFWLIPNVIGIKKK